MPKRHSNGHESEVAMSAGNGDSIQVKFGGELVRRFTDGVGGLLLKAIGPVLFVLLGGGAVHYHYQRIDQIPSAPVSAPREYMAGRMASTEGKVASFDGRLTQVELQLRENNLTMARMDGKLDGILQAVKQHPNDSR